MRLCLCVCKREVAVAKWLPTPHCVLVVHMCFPSFSEPGASNVPIDTWITQTQTHTTQRQTVKPYFTRQRTAERSSNVLTSIHQDGALTPSVSWPHNHLTKPQSQSHQHTRHQWPRGFSTGELWSAVSHVLAHFWRLFRVNLWFFLLCCYITVPSLTDRYYRATLAASPNDGTQAHSETHSIAVNSDPTEMRKRTTSEEVAASEMLSLSASAGWASFYANTWILSAPLPAELPYVVFQILENIRVPWVLLVSKRELAHTGGCTLNRLKHTIIIFMVCWNPDCFCGFFCLFFL